MLEFTQKLHDELLRELQNQDRELELDSFAPDRRPAIAYTAVEKLKGKLKSHVFNKEEEETHFFKRQLPVFHSLLIYYTEKFRLGSVELLYGPQQKSVIMERLFFRIRDFFKENVEFLDYYRSGKTNLDSLYFLRSNSFLQGNTDFLTAIMDLSCCTIYSFKVAAIIAYTRIIGEGLSIQEVEQSEAAPITKRRVKLEWTASNAAFVELGYSLKAEGVFNHGKASVADILDGLAQTFFLTLSNPYRILQEILCRKTGYTTFLDRLRAAFNRYIDGIETRNLR